MEHSNYYPHQHHYRLKPWTYYYNNYHHNTSVFIAFRWRLTEFRNDAMYSSLWMRTWKSLQLLKKASLLFYVYFVGMFGNLRKATVSFLRTSVRPHWTMGSLFRGFSLNLIRDDFWKTCRKHPSFIKIFQQLRVPYLKTCGNFWHCLA